MPALARATSAARASVLIFSLLLADFRNAASASATAASFSSAGGLSICSSYASDNTAKKQRPTPADGSTTNGTMCLLLVGSK